ncbi:hypothetical protein DFJ74DRAFT_683464 [Hyaloraphidium curvatum]|nr:hypothetical protein DFJ74DRAFT_683464 [Hyaloraphidium curvatum]
MDRRRGRAKRRGTAAAVARVREALAAGSYDFASFLPGELSLSIFAHLDVGDLATTAGVSRAWHSLAHDALLWRRLVMRRFSVPSRPPLSGWRSVYRLLDAWAAGRARVSALRDATEPGSVVEAAVAGDFVLTASENAALRVWGPDGMEVPQPPSAEDSGTVACLAMDQAGADGTHSVFVGLSDSRYRLFELDRSGALRKVAKGVLSPDRDTLLAAALWGNTLAVCQDVADLDSAGFVLGISVFRLQGKGRSLRRLATFRSGLAGAPVDVHVSPTGPEESAPLAATVVYSLSSAGGRWCVGLQRFLFDAHTGAFLGSTTGSSDSPAPAPIQALRYDGVRLIATFADNTIRVLEPSADFRNLHEAERLYGHTSSPTAVRVSSLLPGRLVSGARDGTVKVWSLEDGLDAELPRSSAVTLADAQAGNWTGTCGSESIRALAFDHRKVVASREGGRTTVWTFCEA